MKRGKRREARGEKKNMKKRFTLWLLATLFLANVSLADAQQPGKIFRIGLLDPSDARSSAVRLEAFCQEIRKLGWIEGRNFTIESRFSEEKTDRLAELAAELVRQKVDVIVCASTAAALAAKRATTTIPIVMVNSADPVGQVWLPVWPSREAMSQGCRV
jgi:putative tryptophan/tyrosine transport system substrate-binding protein